MPAKKRVEETKSATDIEIDLAHEAKVRGEAAVQNSVDASQDLLVHAARLKQLEAELSPKEVEHKTILDRFQRVLEGSCVYRKQRGPGAHIAAAAEDLDKRYVSKVNPKPATPRGKSIAGTAAEVADEKELTRFMAVAAREVMVAILQPIFMLPRTPNEIHNASVCAARIYEVSVGATQPNDPARPTSGGQPGKTTPRKKPTTQSGPTVPLSQQPLRPEPALQAPLGVDQAIYGEVLKLREQRIASEKGMEDLVAQIKISRDILQRRKDEGSGTKAALRKAEKELLVLTKAYNALCLKKEEEEIIKRKVEEAATAKKLEEKTRKK